MEPPQTLTARRPAASTLPTFQLPPPDSKYAPYTTTTTTQQSILTPPVSAADAATNGLPPYGNQMGYWPPVANAVPFYAFSNAPGAGGQGQGHQGQGQSPNQQQQNQQPPLYNRALYAPQPPTNYPPRPQSSDDALPQQHHQQQQQQYSIALPYPSTTATATSSDSIQQQQPQHDAYGPRPPPTPTYAFPPTTAQHPFPSYTQPSPPPARLSPTTPSGAAGGGAYRPYPYALPTLTGAVMSNVHSPGSQLSLLGNPSAPPQHQLVHPSMQAGGGGGGYPLYPPQGHGGLPVHGYGMGMGAGMMGGGGLDRPFKCDQCPQSFNRNHDLKRHKRIHLAVKPYPCGECEKSFSRKDALKRHVLVKGCGKPSRAPSTHHTSSSISAPSTINNQQQQRGRHYSSNDIKADGPLSSDAESPGGGRGSDE
ncbi:hypothetical protein ACLOAV_001342 [Pseudogymnoascus australis]